jgi:hypothetical protein
LRTLRIGTIQEREKKRMPIINNKRDTLGIYLMTDRIEERKRTTKRVGTIPSWHNLSTCHNTPSREENELPCSSRIT